MPGHPYRSFESSPERPQEIARPFDVERDIPRQKIEELHDELAREKTPQWRLQGLAYEKLSDPDFVAPTKYESEAERAIRAAGYGGVRHLLQACRAYRTLFPDSTLDLGEAREKVLGQLAEDRKEYIDDDRALLRMAIDYTSAFIAFPDLETQSLDSKRRSFDFEVLSAMREGALAAKSNVRLAFDHWTSLRGKKDIDIREATDAAGELETGLNVYLELASDLKVLGQETDDLVDSEMWSIMIDVARRKKLAWHFFRQLGQMTILASGNVRVPPGGGLEVK